MTDRPLLRERQAAVVRDAILDALAHLLETRDPDDIALPQVAADAGVSTRTLYRYFATRDELFAAAGDHIVARLGLRTEITRPEEISSDFLRAAAEGARHPQLTKSMLHSSLGRRSGRPAAGYGEDEFAADALTVMDATATERALVVSLSVGAQRALILAAEHPDRVTGAVFICPAVPFASPVEDRTRYPWDEVLPTDQGWVKDNLYYWLRGYRGFLEFFFSQMFTEPHSTKPTETASAGVWRPPPRRSSRQKSVTAWTSGRTRTVRPGSLPGAGDPGNG